ncbi:MAG: SurA N-terminal domain-containing protein [Myxococcota bacterium]
MLSALRRNKNSPVVLVLLGLVVLLMIGFGTSYQASSGSAFAARVNGSVISESEFNSAYAAEYSRQQQLNPKYDREAAERAGLRKQVLDQMITTRLLAQRAKDMGLAVDDAALREAIVSRPYFQVDGRFSRDRYERVLNSIGQSDRQYEESERERLLAEKLLSAFQGVRPSDAEVRLAFRIQEAKRNAEFVQISKAAFATDDRELSAEDVAAWEESQSDLTETIAEYYRQNKATRYDVPRQVCIQQILIRIDEALPPKARTEKRRRIEEAARRLAKGVPFEEVAAEYSEDPSRAQGGRMPCFAEGNGLPEVEEQAFSMQPGEISPVIRTGFGLHLIRVNEFKEPIRIKLEDAKPEIKRSLAARAQAEFEARALARRLLDAASVEPSLAATLETLKTDVPLQAQTTGPITANQVYLPKLGVAPAVSEMIWKIEPNAPYAEQPVETEDAFVVLRLISESLPDEAGLGPRRSTIEGMLTNTKLNDIFPAWQAALQDGEEVEVNPRVLRYGS